jgi:hypothetical protein
MKKLASNTLALLGGCGLFLLTLLLPAIVILALVFIGMAIMYSGKG